MSERVIHFNMAFSTMFLAMLLNLSPIVILLFLFNVAIGSEIQLSDVLLLVLMTIVLAATFAWIQGRKPTLSLHAEGMDIYDSRAKLQHVRWAAISNITTHNRLGFRFLTFSVQGLERPLLVPLYLSDMPRFYRSLVEFAGAEHPLALAVAQSGTLT